MGAAGIQRHAQIGHGIEAARQSLYLAQGGALCWGTVAHADHRRSKSRGVVWLLFTLWKYAAENTLTPGAFKLRPCVHGVPWHPFLLNCADALFLRLSEVPSKLADDGRAWFPRPVDDSKEVPGTVKTSAEILQLAQQVLQLPPKDIPRGSLRHDTLLMLGSSTDPKSTTTRWPLRRSWRDSTAVTPPPMSWTSAAPKTGCACWKPTASTPLDFTLRTCRNWSARLKT